MTVLVDFLKGRMGEEAEADLFRRETPLVGRTALVAPGSCAAGNWQRVTGRRGAVRRITGRRVTGQRGAGRRI